MRRLRLLLAVSVVCLSAGVLNAAAPVRLKPLEDMKGERHDISQVLTQNKNVVLVFWQTHCSKCVREAPVIVSAAKTYEAEFQFFGIVSGEDEYVDDRKVRKMTESLAFPYPQVRDRDVSLSEAFDVGGTPTIVILGPAMTPIYVGQHAPEDWLTYAPKK